MSYVIHAGVTLSVSNINRLRFRIVLQPEVGIYVPLTIFKDKALCGTMITLYHIESLYLGEKKKTSMDSDFIAISCRKGQRPVYYTDLFHMPRCHHYADTAVGCAVNCPMCKDHESFGLWSLARSDL